MGIRTLVIWSLLLLACKSKYSLSQEEKDLIKGRITNHNRYLDSLFLADSLRERARFEARHHPVPADSISAHMDSFSVSWNRPYSLEKDRHLSFRSFLEYCYTRHRNPVKESKKL